MSASGPPSSSSPQRRRGGDSVASGKPRRSAHLVGRDGDLAAADRLLDAAREGRTGVLVVSGEPGIGKSTVLEQAAAGASGFRVLWTRGVESDAALGHAGLLALLTPVRDLVDSLPGPQAASLAEALGWASGQHPPTPLQVAGATLAVLSAAAAEQPVLVVVDDAHWLDHESASAILFAARRMHDDPVAFLLAARSESPVGADLADLPELALAGLSAAEVHERWPEVVPSVADTLAAGTRGNPLVLGELVPLLTGPQRAGAAPLPTPLPVGARPLSSLGPRLTGLSPEAASLVLLHACAGPGEEAMVATAAVRTGVPLEAALDEAVAARALRVDAGVSSLAHPLLRPAVLARAAPAAQRDAHAALASGADALGRPAAAAWHRAATALGHDDELAQVLAVIADDRSHGGRAVASQALERAASLCSEPTIALAWLARAADEAFLAGDLARTRALAERVLAAHPDASTRAAVLYVLGIVEEYAGSVPRAAHLLAEAAASAEGVLAVRILTELAMTRFRLGDLAGYADCARRIGEVADRGDAYQRMLAVFAEGWAAALAGDLASAGPLLVEALGLVATQPMVDTQTLTVYLGLVYTDPAGALEHTGRRMEEVRRDGLAGILVSALTMRSFVLAGAGDHVGAFAEAGEAVELAAHLGQVADAATAHEALAWQLAARGLHDKAVESLARSSALLEKAGLSTAAAHHALTAAFCALCRDDLPAVITTLAPRLGLDGGLGSMGEPLGVAPLLVEAFVGLGRRDEAADLARRLDEATPPAAPAVLEAPRQRTRALVQDDPDRSRAAFDAALAAYAEVPDVFEVARTRLLLGAWLRRRGERVAAREQLAGAEEAFARMELTAWVAKARAERAATGERARPRGEPPVDEPLTSQETRVALLVARGMSNKEVAAHLFLSPRTVETHLAAVFRKRGYRNRTDLAVRGLGS